MLVYNQLYSFNWPKYCDQSAFFLLKDFTVKCDQSSYNPYIVSPSGRKFADVNSCSLVHHGLKENSSFCKYTFTVTERKYCGQNPLYRYYRVLSIFLLVSMQRNSACSILQSCLLKLLGIILYQVHNSVRWGYGHLYYVTFAEFICGRY